MRLRKESEMFRFAQHDTKWNPDSETGRNPEFRDVEEEPRGRGFQRGIGHLVSCPYCMAPWCASALAVGFVFAPRVTRFFAGILVSVAASDFLHRAYLAAKKNT